MKVFAALVLVGFVAASTEHVPAEPVVDMEHKDEETFASAVGKPFTVRFHGCRACGYEWSLDENDTNGLEVSAPKKTSGAKKGHHGGEHYIDFEVKPNAELKTDLKFTYKRSWENGAAKTAVLHLSVTKDGVVVDDISVSSEPVVDMEHKEEESFASAVGQPFTVRLHGCTACGYEWSLDDNDTNGLEVSDPKTTSAHKDGRHGGMQYIEFEVKPNAEMKTDLHFTYKRSWENGALKKAVLHLSATKNGIVIV